MAIRVAIAGARGIGKHHAKWLAGAGCEVVALFGTTEATARQSAELLAASIGFAGRVFHEWERFLSEGDFDACAVCSPAEHHFANVRDLLRRGVHVLCEKPLVWNWRYSAPQIIAEGATLVRLAAERGVLLGVNAQYPAVLDGWKELSRRITGREPDFSRISFIMETKGAPRSPHGPAEAWVDLGPHPVALIDRISPGTIDWSTLRHRDGPTEAVLDFDWIAPERRLSAHIECRRVPGPLVHRQLSSRNLTLNLDARMVDGEFCAVLRPEAQPGAVEWVGPDFMRVSVERFVEAVRTQDDAKLLVNGEAGLRQLEVLARVWERCWAPSS